MFVFASVKPYTSLPRAATPSVTTSEQRPEWGSVRSPVRRAKGPFSGGCEPRTAATPAGTNRRPNGGDEMGTVRSLAASGRGASVLVIAVGA
jgi:hypothetical protein